MPSTEFTQHQHELLAQSNTLMAEQMPRTEIHRDYCARMRKVAVVTPPSTTNANAFVGQWGLQQPQQRGPAQICFQCGHRHFIYGQPKTPCPVPPDSDGLAEAKHIEMAKETKREEAKATHDEIALLSRTMETLALDEAARLKELIAKVSRVKI